MGCSCVKAAAAPPQGDAPAAPAPTAAASGAPPCESQGERPAAEAPGGQEGLRGAAAAAEGHWAQVSAWAWGRGEAFGEPGPNATPARLAVKGRSLRGFAAAWDQTLLVANSGALWGAGDNAARCLFDERDSGPQRVGKVDLPELEGQCVEAAAGGRAHLVAILEAGGRVLSWGRGNEFGQLGHSAASSPSAASPRAAEGAAVGPRAVALPAPRLPVRQVACGEVHSLVLTVGGMVYAFGDNSSGALGLGSSTGSATQPACVESGALLAAPVRSIAAGARHSLASTLGGSVLAWGCAEHGRLGLGEGVAAVVWEPAELPALPGHAKCIAGGGRHSAVLLSSGVCLLAGDNRHGQLGHDPAAVTERRAFHALPAAGGAPGWRSVALGDAHTLLLGDDGGVRACGRADQGQLGSGAVEEASWQLRRVALPNGAVVLALAAGPEHSAALIGEAAAPAAAQEAMEQEAAPPAQEAMEEPPEPPDPARPPAPPGVCEPARPAALDTAALRGLAEAVAGAPEGSRAAEEFVRAVAGVLALPSLMNASFSYRGLEQRRVDSDGVLEAFGAAWPALSASHHSQLRTAVAHGLGRWAGDPKEWQETPPALRRADQVAGLAVLLLSPLISDVEQGSEGYALAVRVMATIAALPTEGRRAFIGVVAEDMVSCLRSALVPRVRAFCDAAIRRSAAEKHMATCVWDALLVLHFLACANRLAQQRLQAGLQTDPGREKLQRALSRRPSVRSAAGAAAPREFQAVGRAIDPPVPAEDFLLEALTEGVVPPDVEFALFVQNARTRVPRTEELLGMRPHDDRHRCFTAHREVVPAAFVRNVLNVENRYRQMLQQQQGLQDTMLAALVGQAQLGRNGGLSIDESKFFFPINVRREHLLEDTLQVLQDAAPSDLQKQLKVTFRGEEGQDAGGVSREFFRLLSGQLFVLESRFFEKAVAEEARVLWFDRTSARESVDFWMLGVVLGLAVYNSLPGLDVAFPVCVFKKLRGEPLGLDDLLEVQPTVASSMRALLAWEPEESERSTAAEVFSNTFCLDFSASYEDEAGVAHSQDLVPGGRDVPVTLENRDEFVKLYCAWVLTGSVSKQFEPFKTGFGRVGESPLLRALTGVELARIVMGEVDIELERLQPKAKYEGFGPADECVLWFWDVLRELAPAQRRAFLSFVTGSDRSPVGGLGEVQLTVQRGPSDPAGKRLPSAHTCFNTLLLPAYTSRKKLRDALLMAIENTEGFGLE